MAITSKVKHAYVWSAVEKFSSSIAGFIFIIYLARILSPEEIGLIGIILAVTNLSQTVIESGFGSALIRKGRPMCKEYSTVFVFNIVASVIIYILLYFIAPYISAFYEEPSLEKLLRWTGLIVIISSFSMVQKVKLQIDLNFKLQSKISFISVVTSGLIAIYLANTGYGVWALVVQNILFYLINSILIVLFSGWNPRFKFNFNIFCYMFNYSYKILLANLIATFYRHLYTLIIGKKFSVDDLGYYNQADQLSRTPAMLIATVIQRVSLPALSQINDRNKRKYEFLKTIFVSSILFMPAMAWTSVNAIPLTVILLGEKWAFTGELMAIICLATMFSVHHSLNLNMVQISGRSDLFLKSEVIKKVTLTILILVTIDLGIIAMCWALFVNSCLGLFINMYYCKKVSDINIVDQLKIVVPILLLCSAFILVGNYAVAGVDSPYVRVFLTSLIFAAFYLSCFLGKRNLIMVFDVKSRYLN